MADHDGLVRRLRVAIGELNRVVADCERAGFGVALGDPAADGKYIYCSSTVGERKKPITGGLLSVPVLLAEEEGDEYHVG